MTEDSPKPPDKHHLHRGPAATPKGDKGLSDLNDGELKELLDEAMKYRNPKDREGKSKLFNQMLNAAEEVERNARASRAGGSELVRYCNPSAKRGSRHHRNKKPSSSLSETVMHGGSLDNLAKEELYDMEVCKQRTRKSVSARQKEGGSLPCNVNASTHLEYQFLEEAKRNKERRDYIAINMEGCTLTNSNSSSSSSSNNNNDNNNYNNAGNINSYNINNNVSKKKSYDESSMSLLEHDSLQQVQDYQEEQMMPTGLEVKYTSRATFQVNNVDDPIPIGYLTDQSHERKSLLDNKLVPNKCNVYLTSRSTADEPKKVDENGNALQQSSTTTTNTTSSSTTLGTKNKKNKMRTDKNVVVLKAENVEGHRSDIINDVEKLMEYIGEAPHYHDNNTGGGGGGNTVGCGGNVAFRSLKSKLNRHASDENNGGKKQRAHSSKSKDNNGGGGGGNGGSGQQQLKKCNSLGEISSCKMEDFEFESGAQGGDRGGVVGGGGSGGKGGKSGAGGKKETERPRERRSWGNMDPIPIQYQQVLHNSAESLETAEFRVVTKKKRSRKRRNSIDGGAGGSSSGVPPSSTPAYHPHHHPHGGTGGSNYSRHAGGASSSGSYIVVINRGGGPSKSASSVPHSDKSNDSSDVDSVHSLPIDPARAQQRPLDLVVTGGGGSSVMPVSYADMARISERQQQSAFVGGCGNVSNNGSCGSKKIVPKGDSPLTIGSEAGSSDFVNNTSTGSDSGSSNSSKYNQPPDVHNIKSFPAISSTVTTGSGKSAGGNNSNKLSFAALNNGGGKSTGGVMTTHRIVMNSVVNLRLDASDEENDKRSVVTVLENSQDGPDCQKTMAGVEGAQCEVDSYSRSLPPDIPDVQTIEKMQLMGQGHRPPLCYQPNPPVTPNNNNNKKLFKSTDCDNNNKTTPSSRDYVTSVGGNGANKTGGEQQRPAVVILSGLGGNSKDACCSGLVFGFDINEQLLLEDGFVGGGDDTAEGEEGQESEVRNGCAFEDFVTRYFVPPEVFTDVSHNHDKIVAFIGTAWEDVRSVSDGTVQYYVD